MPQIGFKHSEESKLKMSKVRKGRFCGENHPGWKGKDWITTWGYRMIWADGERYLEHRYIMEQILGRPLKKEERVHHNDGNRLNNIPSNLQLFENNGKHISFELGGKLNYKLRKYKRTYKLYEPEKENEIVTLYPNKKTFICKRCIKCNTLFWTRLDGIARFCNMKCAAEGRKRRREKTKC